MEKRWEVLSELKANGKRLPAGEAGLTAESVVETLLKNRDIKDPDSFFNPPKPDYLISALGGSASGGTRQPNYLPDLDRDQLERATARIKLAIENDEKITVWGDYDVDGVTATAILWEALSKLGAKVLPYIPNRFTEGYGLNREAIEKLSKEGTSLIVTVDSGITAKEEVEYTNSLGLDVIVTDHHVKPKELPPAYAIVHTTGLCGAGVAWVLASQLNPKPYSERRRGRRFSSDSEGFLSARGGEGSRAIARGSYTLNPGLDLVAIATVADIQPLLGANRSLVKYGFEVLNKAERPGLAALMEVAGLKPGGLGSYAAGWVLGPRLNAVGRLQKGIEALRLLCIKDKTAARRQAHLLEAANKERQALTEEIFDHAKDLINNQAQLDHLTVAYHDSWHEGIIGLVAGKLVEEYGRPAVVIAKSEKFSKGSARSVNGFDILEALREHSDLLEDVGGHAMAAGFTVTNDRLEEFIKALKRASLGKLKDLDPRPVLKIDAELPLHNLKLELISELEKFGPHGVGNPEPLFVAHGVNVLEERKVGRQKQHLKLSVSPGFEALWFGHGKDGGFTLGEEVSFAYTPFIERWDGKEKVTLRIRDLKKG